MVIADEQTAGRGRLDRKWFTPRDTALAFSIVLRPTAEERPHLTRVVGLGALAVAVPLRKRGVDARIKWPNDILIGGKKVGGVLVELDKGLKKQSTFLVGIGLNVNTTENELPKQTRLPATSLAIEKKGFIDRILLAKALLQDIDKWLSILKDEHFGYITERWKNLC